MSNKVGRPKGSITKKESKTAKYTREWEEALPDLVSQNVRLQKRALNVIELKIDECSAKEAATVYGILHDKCNTLIGPKETGGNTYNMYLGNMDIADADANGMASLMERVADRMRKDEAIDVESEEIDGEEPTDEVGGCSSAE